MTPKKTRTMYMHTLDGSPASFQWLREREGQKIVRRGYVHFIGHGAVKLASTLRQIRREQKAAIRDALPQTRWGEPRRYGYVRVEVPCV